MPLPSAEPAPDSDVYRTLLESTKAIPWRIDWKTLRFTYIGPQIETLLGWTPDSWATVEDWAARMHPEDRERVVNFCVSQSQAGTDHEADYRALTAGGGYVWIRDVVHVVRKEGEVEALIGFMFDISERKATEEQLLTLQQELEALSYRDGLTGVANRRMFDTVFDLEWARARQNRQPLSVILADVDHFKEYNDHYGHLAGDDSLKLVAQALGSAAARARDFVARFGGEEFAIVLPEADAAAGSLIAERCRQAIAELAIPHAAIGGRLSISLGVGTLIPNAEDDPRRFLDQVDGALYAAKDRGRDRVESV
ncbi:diguanylate cyclase [Azoarcus indigens]|uniref:diguanylate cyclase n=1 Tax=Azoarcus indigens TaxID=29545 RepID=A0A4R6E164_9RHOO|nr:sensor domain-containing diguanylate cyclase [Azoarcus indigens]NMG67769.1 diguanylate cyclase [Azoarcus indigens]TDN51455.1 PAS domain S-box-containing protein/diguanylate cyclase (GGDEF)-like protein [Azoarcus indigens]